MKRTGIVDFGGIRYYLPSAAFKMGLAALVFTVLSLGSFIPCYAENDLISGLTPALQRLQLFVSGIVVGLVCWFASCVVISLISDYVFGGAEKASDGGASSEREKAADRYFPEDAVICAIISVGLWMKGHMEFTDKYTLYFRASLVRVVIAVVVTSLIAVGIRILFDRKNGGEKK